MGILKSSYKRSKGCVFGMSKRKKAITILGAGIIVYILFRFLFFTVFPLVIAVAVGKFLEPVIAFLQKKCRLPKLFSVVLPVVIFFSVVAIAIYFLSVLLCNQLLELIRSIPSYQKMFTGQLSSLCSWCDNLFFMEDGTAFQCVCEQLGKWCNTMTQKGIAIVTVRLWQCIKWFIFCLGIIGIIIIVTSMFVMHYDEMREKYHACLFYEDIEKLLRPLTKVGFAYFKAQVIIIAIVSVICTVGFYYTGSHYALLLGILTSVLDAFPILGCGILLFPAILLAVFKKAWFSVVIYLLVWGACQCVRQFLEPKLIGEKLGISPFYILLSVYFGLEFFGVVGVITGPAALVLLRSIVNYVEELEKVSSQKEYF